MVTRGRYSTCAVGEIEAAGFEVLATIARPHADVVLSELSTVWGRVPPRAPAPRRGAQPVQAQEVNQ